MQINNTEVYGFRRALYGMRLSRNSYHKADSVFADIGQSFEWEKLGIYAAEHPALGINDLELAKKLVKAGPEHRKFLRQIYIWVDLTLPRFLWIQLGTYQVGITKNSESTMYGLQKKKLTQEDFEYSIDPAYLAGLNEKIADLNNKDYSIEEISNDLPAGFLQTATVTFNYENALNIYFQRRHHKLAQWKIITSWIGTLPFFKQLIIDTFENKTS